MYNAITACYYDRFKRSIFKQKSFNTVKYIGPFTTSVKLIDIVQRDNL